MVMYIYNESKMEGLPMLHKINKIFLLLPFFSFAIADENTAILKQIQATVQASANASVPESMNKLSDAYKQGTVVSIPALEKPAPELVDAMKNLKVNVDLGFPSIYSTLGVGGALLSSYYLYQWSQTRDTKPDTGTQTGWLAGLGLAASILTLFFGR